MRWVRANAETYGVDPERLAAYGHSSGGQLAALLGVRETRDDADPALAGIEAALAKQPKISVPTINLHGGHDGVGAAPEQDNQAKNFTGPYSRRLLPRIGHNVPQEAPADTVTALRDLMRETTR